MARRILGIGIGLLVLLQLVPEARARITRVVFTRVESPTFGGASFGAVGQFEKLVGTAYGEVDPDDPHNAIIQDIELAPRNARGMVEYSTGVYIIKPIDMSKGNEMLFYNVHNRGNKGGLNTFNIGVVGGNEPTVSSGHFTGLTHASYPTVSTDNLTPLPDGFLPTLTQRRHVNDLRVLIPSSKWSFASCLPGQPVTVDATKICYPDGFQPGVLYELIYRGMNPTVLGLGWASERDLMSFFKHAAADDDGQPNPLLLAGGRPALAVVEGSSQSGRSIRTFIHLGFNEDEGGRIVFEGAFPHIGGGRLSMNIRFAAPGRAWGYTVDHLYPAYEFPFSYMPTHDPITRRTGGLLLRCLASHTCPKIFHVATALEIWEGRQSLGFTDPLGLRDLPDSPFVRTYIMASTQHGTAGYDPVNGPGFGDCEQQQNPNPQAETMRALWVAFTAWVKDGAAPPPSTKPRVDDGTFVRPENVNFPSIPANAYPNESPAGPAAPTVRPAVRWQHVATPLHVLDFGPGFDGQDETGIITIEPPAEGHVPYGVHVPQVDADGNDLAGIRSVTLQVPLATYTGWNMGAAGRFEDGLCSLSGSYVPFAPTEADRVAGDPRPSIQSRYGTHDGYVAAVRAAAERLVALRFLLPDDAARLIAQAAAGNVLR